MSPPRPWKPKRHRRRARLTEPMQVLVSESMKVAVDAAAALMGMTRSAFVRSAVLRAVDRARSVQPNLPMPAKDETG